MQNMQPVPVLYCQQSLLPELFQFEVMPIPFSRGMFFYGIGHLLLVTQAI